jgi:RND family efflux transporter MFP subunit
MFAKAILPLIVLLLAAVLTGALIANRPEAQQQPGAVRPLNVEVVVAERQPVQFQVASRGEVTPRTATMLMSEVSGQIVEVSDSFVAGGFFRKGDVLVRIDPRNYETAVKRARASVARARTQVSTENALAGYALEDWERLQALRAAPKEASDLTLRKPQLAQALAELELAEAELEKANGDLARTAIYAPYDGMVRSKSADVGQYVNTGSPLVSIFATDHAEVRLPLTANDLRYIRIPEAGSTDLPVVQLRAEVAGSEQLWQARLVRTEGVYDAESRVLYAVAQVDDPYRQKANADAQPLRVGSFVTATIEGRDAGALYRLPRDVLYRGDRVWVVNEDDALEPRQVEVVRTDHANVYIDQGLNAGDRVCLTRLTSPLPGTRVQLSDV